MPAVLVELGFLTNPGEEDFLQSTQGKELLASAIYRAVKEYKFKREQRDAGIQTEGSSLTPISLHPFYCTCANAGRTVEAAAEVWAEETTREATTEPVEAPEMELFFAVQIAVSRNDLPCLPENFKGVESVWKQEQYGLYKYLQRKIGNIYRSRSVKTKCNGAVSRRLPRGF